VKVSHFSPSRRWFYKDEEKTDEKQASMTFPLFPMVHIWFLKGDADTLKTEIGCWSFSSRFQVADSFYFLAESWYELPECSNIATGHAGSGEISPL